MQGAITIMGKFSVKPAVLDRAEQVIIVLLWAWFAQRMIVSDSPFAPLLMISEASVAFFVLIRRPTDSISTKMSDWTLAIIATALPLLIDFSTNDPVLVPLAIFLIIFGNLWQICAKLFLRRSFGVAPANRGVKSSGPYRFMRHPIYAGYFLTHVAGLLLFPSMWNAAVYICAWTVQIMRLRAEENLLGQDSAYRAYQSRVRYRLIPGIY